ncbi:MAG: hypothetical protein ABEJ42_10500 [Halobacteriaceae archaeon]
MTAPPPAAPGALVTPATSALVAILAGLVVALWFGREWLAAPPPESAVDPTTAPGDELPPTPGDEYDENVDGPAQGATVRRDLRRHLEERLVAEHGLSESAATEAVETGAWTDDPRAAAWVRGDAIGRLPLRRRLRLWRRGRDPTERGLAHAVAAVEALDVGDDVPAGGKPDGRNDGEGTARADARGETEGGNRD